MALINSDLQGADIDTLRRVLGQAFGGYGFDDSDFALSTVRQYGEKGWETVEGQYNLSIQHSKVTGPGSIWQGVVSGGPNATLMIKQGAGHQMFIGDLHTATEAGLPTNTVGPPIYSGVESFARRVSAAFGLQKERMDDPYDRSTVMDRFRFVNTVRTPSPASYETPEGKIIKDVIPASNVRIEPTTSPLELQYQANTYNVPIVTSKAGDVDQFNAAIDAINRQTRTLGASGLNDPFYKLHGGGVLRPRVGPEGPITGGTFIAPSAIGTQYVDEAGRTQLDALTEKFLKQTYTAGRRDVAPPGIMTDRGTVPVPERFLATTNLSLRGEGGFTGIPVQAATMASPMVVQSGQGQFNLPPELRKYVTGMGGMMVATREKTMELPIQLSSKVNSLSRFSEAMPALTFDQYGETLPRGGVDPVTLIAGNKKAGIMPVVHTPGQQYEQINQMNMLLPMEWSQGMTEAQVEPYLKDLRSKGFANVRFAPVETPSIEAGMTISTMGGAKMAGTKMQTDLPLAGISPQLRTGTGAVPYNVLQPSKLTDATILNMLQALEAQGNLTPFISALFQDNPNVPQAFRDSESMNMLDIAQASGAYETGQQLLEAIGTRTITYGNQEQLYKDFGVGLMSGQVPIQQFDPLGYTDFREQFIQTMMRGEQFGNIENPLENMSREQAVAAFNKQVKPYMEFDKSVGPSGTYTFWQPADVLMHPKLQTFVQEESGLGSMQYEVDLGLRGQGQRELADWIQNNQQSLTPSTPAQWAIRQASRGWSASQMERITDPGQFMTIMPEQAEQIQRRVGLLLGRNLPEYGGGALGEVHAYRDVMREVLPGLTDLDSEPVFWLQGQKTGVLGPEAVLQLESLQYGLDEAGITHESQSKVVERAATMYSHLFSAESQGTVSEFGRYRAMQLQSNYIDSEQIRKLRGGLFAKPTGTGMIPPGMFMMTQDALEKHYRQQGGRGVGTSKEWQRYLAAMEGAAVVAERFPAPNVGSTGMPGSIVAGKITTPYSKTGGFISELIKSSGIMRSDVLMSNLNIASQGDVDYDPWSFLPTVLRTEKGRWSRFNPKAGNQEEYRKWLQSTMAQQSVQTQQATMDKIYGVGQAQFNPYSSAMAQYMQWMTGDKNAVGSFLDKRLSLQSTGMQDAIAFHNKFKGREMGRLYNAFLRRIDVAGSMLGVPEEAAAFARDTGIVGYQKAIDFEEFVSDWTGMMQSGGLFYDEKTGGVQYGYFGENDTFTGNVWHPSQSTGMLSAAIGTTLAGQASATPEMVAALTMNLPERGDMERQEYLDMIEQRRGQIADTLRPIMERRDEMTPAAFTSQVMSAMEGMVTGDDPLVGGRSFAVHSAMPRMLEFTSRDTDRMANVRRAIDKSGGFMHLGEKMSYDDMARRMNAFSTMFQYSKHVEGTDLSKAMYKDPRKIANALIVAAENQGIESPLVKQFARTWGDISGFTPAEGGGYLFTDPYSGQPRLLRDINDLATLEESWRERVMAEPYGKVKEILAQFPQQPETDPNRPGQKVRASSLGYIGADFSNAGPKPARLGHQVHGYIEKYLKAEQAAGASNIRMVEEEAELIPGTGLYGKIDTVMDIDGEETQIDWKTGVGEPESYAGQQAGYRAYSKSPNVAIGKIDSGEARAMRQATLLQARRERGAAGTATFTPYEKSAKVQSLEKGMANIKRMRAEAIEEIEQLEKAGAPEEDIEPIRTRARALTSQFDAAVREHDQVYPTEFRQSEQAQYESELLSRLQRKRSSLVKSKIAGTSSGPTAELDDLVAEGVQHQRSAVPMSDNLRTQIEAEVGAGTLENRVAARRPLSAYQTELGEELYNLGMSNLHYLDDETTGPKSLERYLTKYAESKGIPLAAGGGSGMGGGVGGRGVATAVPDPDEDPKRQVTIAPRARQQAAGQRPTSQQEAQQRANVAGEQVIKHQHIYGTSNAMPKTPKAAKEYFDRAAAQFEKYIGKFGETGKTLEPGMLTEGAKDAMSQLAALFPEQEDRDKILGAGDQYDQLTMAETIAREKGINLKKMVRQSGLYSKVIDPIGGLMKSFRTVAALDQKGLLTEVPGEKHQTLQGMLAASATPASTGAIDRLGAQGELISNMTMKAEILNESFKTGMPGTGRVLDPNAGTVAKDWVRLISESTSELEKQNKQLRTYKGEVKEFNDVIKEGLGGERGGKVAQRLRVSQKAMLEAEEAASAVRKQYGMRETRRGLLSSAELETIKGKGEMGVDARKALRQYEAKDYTARLKEINVLEEARGEDITGEQPRGAAGKMARRMLGGFGLMYMRSIGGIMASGLTQGYQESQAQRQAVLQGMAATGGALPQFTPDERLAQAQAIYGGQGWAALQEARARSARVPWQQGLQGAAAAGIGAGGMALTLGLWGATGVAGLAAPLAAGAMVAQQAISTYGAMQDVEGTGTGVATRLMDMTPEERQQFLNRVPWANRYQGFMDRMSGISGTRQMEAGERALVSWLQSPFDSGRAAWQASPEAQELTRQIIAIDEREEGGVRDYIRDTMGLSGIEAQQMEARYYQAMASTEGVEVSAAGFIGAAQLQERYGLDLDSQQQQFLAGGIINQAPWVSTAMSVGQRSYRTYEEQQQMVAETLERWTREGGRTEKELALITGGEERIAALGMYGPQARNQEEEEWLAKRYGNLTQDQYDLLKGRYDIGTMRRTMGFEWTPPQAMDVANLTPEEIRQQQVGMQREEQLTRAQFNVYQGFTGLGMMPEQINMSRYQDYTIGELSNVTELQQMGMQLQAMLPTAGWSREASQAMGQTFTNLPIRHARRLFGMGQGNQADWARYAIANPEVAQQLANLQMPGMGGSTISLANMGMVDISPQGTMTGLPWGTTSLATPFFSSQQMASRIWGADYASNANLSQGLIGAMIEGGRYGGQMWQQQQQAAHSQAMAGLQLQQLDLTQAFQTGVGIGDYSGIVNPQTGQPFGFHQGRFNVNVRGVGGFTTQGGGLWGVQDAMRGLGWMQQEWNFGRQREQAQMQDTFWQQNFNLNMRGAMMQRPWRREDWAFQDTQRAQQWAWRQEDFQEESRFMTGRDRRLAERQMARETIVYGQEGEQIDRQRKRQEELWKLEDERFTVQEQQHREALEFQMEGIKIQESFYEERKRLEQEQIKLTRAYYVEQMELQRQQIEASAAYAKIQQEIAETMLLFQQNSEKLMAEGGLFNEDTWASIYSVMQEIDPELASEFWDNMMAGMKEAFEKGYGQNVPDWGDDPNEEPKPPKPTTNEPDDDWIPPGDDVQGARQHGGRVTKGHSYYVGEAGTEIFQPYFTGDVVPSYKTNPWETTMISPSGTSSEQQLIQLILNLGGEHFREYILNAVDSEIDV